MANISRRKFLMTAAVLPLVAIIPLKALAATGQIHEIEGDVFINQIKINSTSKIRNGDEIVVSKNGKLVFIMGEDAFLVRGGSTLQVYLEREKQQHAFLQPLQPLALEAQQCMWQYHQISFTLALVMAIPI